MLASLYEHRTKPKVVEKAPKQPLNSFTRKSNEIPNTVCNASLKDKIYTLTSKTNQKGAMWVPCESDGVLVSFKISNAVSNGDGFAVVMQTDGPSAIGGNRYNKGFGGIKEGIAVAFNLNQNNGNGDKNKHYIAVFGKPKVPLSSHVKNSIILNDEVKQTYWDHVQHEIKVLFNEQRLTCWVDDVEQITCVLPSATWKSIVNKQKFIGVTCSTGVKYTICKIYDFSVYYLDCPETKARVHFTTKSKQQIHLVGDAKYKRDCISIIDGANSVGAMWTKIAGRKNFLIKLEIQNSMISTDGFAVVLQNQGKSALGEKDGGKGFAGISQGYAIEFSSFSRNILNDPMFQHIAIMKSNEHGISSHHQDCLDCCTSPPVKFWDGKPFIVEVIIYDDVIVCWANDFMCCRSECEGLSSLRKSDLYIGVTASSSNANTCLIRSFEVLY